MLALLQGDPAKPGSYTLRMRMGTGYTLGLHQHPDEEERLTVLSGTLHWSTGTEGNDAPEHVLPAGGLHRFPRGHAALAKGDGGNRHPGDRQRAAHLIYLNPTEDPRAKH